MLVKPTPVWIDGDVADNSCTLVTYASYLRDAASGLPATGETMHVRGVAWNTGACGVADRTTLYFSAPWHVVFLPQTQCIRSNGHGYSEAVACPQLPYLGFEGVFFTAVDLPPGWYFEARFAVNISTVFDGANNPAHRLRLLATSNRGNVTTWLPLHVAFRPKFENHSVEATASSATVELDYSSYSQATTIDIVYGTDGSAPHVVPAGASDTLLTKTHRTATLSNLASGTTYYWRARVITPTAIFYGPLQSFTTLYTLQRPPTVCRPPYCP